MLTLKPTEKETVMASTAGKTPTGKTTTGETQMTDVQLREAVVQLLERDQGAART